VRLRHLSHPGSSDNSSDLCSGEVTFEYRPRYEISSLTVFVTFLSPSRPMLGQYLKLCHDRFLPILSNPLFTMNLTTGYGLDDREVGVPSPGRAKNFLHVVQTGSGAHPASPIQWAPGALFPGVKQPGSEADHSSPSSADVKKM
jgi:hypothetical protein